MKKREFKTGANRNSNKGKFEYFKFSHPLNDYSFAKYMHSKRFLEDGSFRDADNWQKGIPQESLIDSLTRHVKELELLHYGFTLVHTIEETGEHTHVFENKKDAETYIKKNVNTQKATITGIIDVLNAIRFNAEAYKLQELTGKKI